MEVGKAIHFFWHVIKFTMRPRQNLYQFWVKITCFFHNLRNGSLFGSLSFFNTSSYKSPPINFFPFKSKIFILRPMLENNCDCLLQKENQSQLFSSIGLKINILLLN